MKKYFAFLIFVIVLGSCSSKDNKWWQLLDTHPQKDPGKWNTMEITLDGARTVGLQNHDSKSTVYIKEFAVKPLK